MTQKNISEGPKFHELSIPQRQDLVIEKHKLTSDEAILLRKGGGLSWEQADKMQENVITTISFPVGIVPHFLVNGKTYDVPMALEEPSVIAGVCNINRMVVDVKRGITASVNGSIMEGHIQFTGVPDMDMAIKSINWHAEELLAIANATDRYLVEQAHGGALTIGARVVKTQRRDMLAVCFTVDCKEAMGANAVNKMAEAIASKITKDHIITGTCGVRILSNLTPDRLATASATFDKKMLGGEQIVERIIEAGEFADAYIKRGATHNKGIMNGIDGIALATGQDWRALEADAHAFATYGHSYGSLTKYFSDEAGNLKGIIKIPIAVGTVGGSAKSHPMAMLLREKIMGIENAAEFSEVMAAVGLVQNVGAVRALVAEGIVKGHNAMHGKKDEIKEMEAEKAKIQEKPKTDGECTK